MKYVLIEDGVVVQVDLTETPPEGYIEASDDVHAGDHFVEGRFVSPEVETGSVPEEISDRQFFQQLSIMGLISEEEAEAAVSTGTLPPAMLVFIGQLPTEQQFPARMLLKGATSFRRSNPFVSEFGAMQGMTSSEIDDLWRAAAAL